MPLGVGDPVRAAELRRSLDAGKPGALADAAVAARTLLIGGAAWVDVERLAVLALEAGAERAVDFRTALEWAHSVGRPAPGALLRPVAADLAIDDLLADCPTALAQCRAVARRATCCADLPALVFLAAVSAALAAKVRGVTQNNDGTEWAIWPHLYVGAEAPSGANKSLCLDAMLRQQLCDEGNPWHDFSVAAEAGAADDAIDREEHEAERAKLRRVGTAENRDRLREIALRLAKPAVRPPKVAELEVNSPENFVRVCGWSGFRCVCLDEAKDFLSRFIGDQQHEAKVAPLIAGFDGGEFGYSSIAREQRGDDRPRFPRMHLTLVLLLQEGVLAPRVQAEAQRLHQATDRGFFPRCLIARPRALTRAERHALEAEAMAARASTEPGPGDDYRAILQSIARVVVGEHPLAPMTPLRVAFSPEATRARRAYQLRCGDDVAADGPDHGKSGARSIARLHDHAARIAICLAGWRCAEQAHAAGRPLDLSAARVELADVERAIRACETYFRPHALAVAGRAIVDEVADDAVRVLEVLAPLGEATARDLTRKLGRGWGPRSNARSRLDLALEHLSALGHVAVQQCARRSQVVRLVGVPEP